MVKSCFHDEEVGKHPASSAGVNGMSVLWLDSAILVNEGSEAREFSGWELQWWGRTVGGGLLGASVVGGWLLGTPVVGLFGWAVVGSSLNSLHVCVSRGTSVASVDVVVVVSIETMWAQSAGRVMWAWGVWLQTAAAWLVAATQRGAAPIRRPVGDPVELLMVQGSDQGILHLDCGGFMFGNVFMHAFPRAAALEHASLALRFLSRGNRRLLSSEANHCVIILVWMAATFSQRSSSARSISSMNRSFSCALWRIRVKYSSLCDGGNIR